MAEAAESSVPESVRDEEEEMLEEQKDDGKMGFCEIQWQQRKFSKKNFKRLDDAKKFNLSISKIDEEKVDEKVQIIRLTSPMKVRSPLGYRSSYNLSVENQIPSTPANTLNVTNQKPHPPVTRQVHVAPPQKEAISASQDNLRKSSILSLRSLSLSLRMLMPIKFQKEEEHSELGTIDESKTYNDTEFQKFPPHAHGVTKSRKFTIFKNQKIYDRRSSMSDIPDDPTSNQQQRNLQIQNASGPSSSTTNVKQDHHHHHPHHHYKKHEHHKNQKSQDKDTLKEVRRRNIESAKRMQTAPRRISTAY